jgi:hypothetical protein
MTETLLDFLKKYFVMRPSGWLTFFIWIIVISRLTDMTCLEPSVRIPSLLISMVGLQVSLIWWFR